MDSARISHRDSLLGNLEEEMVRVSETVDGRRSERAGFWTEFLDGGPNESGSAWHTRQRCPERGGFLDSYAEALALEDR